MVLFDKADIKACYDSVVMVRHLRVKLFNDNARQLANIRLPFYAYQNMEAISSVEAQTIQLENNMIVVTKLDPQLIYTEVLDKNTKAMVFAFPDIRPGCVIEYTFKWKTTSPTNLPPWYFQTLIPTRYSELTITLSKNVSYNTIKKGYQRFVVDTIEHLNDMDSEYDRRIQLAKANVHSFVVEPFINAGNMNLQCIRFQLHAVANKGIVEQSPEDSWIKIAVKLEADDNFGGQMDQSLSKADTLIKHAMALKSNDEKIAWLFSEVKKAMKWNNINKMYTSDGVRKAWLQKTGNSTEINLILYNLLRKTGINAFAMVVSTPENGSITPGFASLEQINKTVVFIPIDNNKFYILDATSKYNAYNEVPAELLNTYGMAMVKLSGKVGDGLVLLKNPVQALQQINIEAEIKPDSKVTGSAVITDHSYLKAGYHQLYDQLGESKYIDFLRGNNNRLKISDMSFENMEVDTLPLIQKFKFDLELSASDDNYIYLNPNLFSPLQNNPFVSEERFSDIDFGSSNFYNITGTYKIPAGYKIDVMPTSVALNMDDKSITFKRLMGENDGSIEVNYIISYKRSAFKVTEYQAVHEFYKKMFEMMSDPIVLKKIQ